VPDSPRRDARPLRLALIALALASVALRCGQLPDRRLISLAPE
jgi:hypothetical protein